MNRPRRRHRVGSLSPGSQPIGLRPAPEFADAYEGLSWREKVGQQYGEVIVRAWSTSDVAGESYIGAHRQKEGIFVKALLGEMPACKLIAIAKLPGDENLPLATSRPVSPRLNGGTTLQYFLRGDESTAIDTMGALKEVEEHTRPEVMRLIESVLEKTLSDYTPDYQPRHYSEPEAM